jgi:hypothetical protein
MIFSQVTHRYTTTIFLSTFSNFFLRWSVLLRFKSPSLQLCQKWAQRRKGAPRERERDRDQNENDAPRWHLSGGPVSWPSDADSPNVAFAELRQWNGYETWWFNLNFYLIYEPNASTTLMTDWHVFHGCRLCIALLVSTFFSSDCWYLQFFFFLFVILSFHFHRSTFPSFFIKRACALFIYSTGAEIIAAKKLPF